jgi:hypothetical protein
LLRRGGYKEYNNLQIPNFILERMPWLVKEKYMLSGYFPNTSDFMYYGDMEYSDFLTQYELEWLERFGVFLTKEEVERMFMGNHPIEYTQISANDELYAGIDFATGASQDDTSISIFKKIGNLKRKVFGTTWNDLPIPDQKRELINLIGKTGRFHCKSILGDVGGNGEAIISDLRAEEALPIYGVSFGATDKDVKMVSMNMKTSMYNDLKKDLQNGLIQHYGIDSNTPKEMQMQYRKDKREWETLEQETRADTVNKKIGAPEGEHDDVCCLSKDTLIPLLDGNIIAIKDLTGNSDDKYTYSLDDNNNIVAGRILRVWKKGEQNTVKVNLDDGSSFKCTADHLIKLRDGNYLEAGKLQVEQSIMPLYKSLRNPWKNSKRKYGYVYNPAIDDWIAIHRQISRIKKLYHQIIHHKDFNSLNNNPTNLIVVTPQEHRRIHSNSFWGNMTKEQRRLRIQPAITATIEKSKYITKEQRRKWGLARTKNMKEKHGDNILSEISKRYWNNLTQEEKNKRAEPMKKGFMEMSLKQQKERIRKAILTRTNNPIIHSLWIKRISETRKKRFAEGIIVPYNKGKICSDKVRKFVEMYPREKLMELYEQYGEWRKVGKILNVNEDFLLNMRKKYLNIPVKLNHKVVSIEDYGIEEVYDMEIETYHNFAIDVGNGSGIFVHNCSDILANRASKLGGRIIGKQQILLHKIPYAIVPSNVYK